MKARSYKSVSQAGRIIQSNIYRDVDGAEFNLNLLESLLFTQAKYACRFHL